MLGNKREGLRKKWRRCYGFLGLGLLPLPLPWDWEEDTLVYSCKWGQTESSSPWFLPNLSVPYCRVLLEILDPLALQVPLALASTCLPLLA